MDTSITHLDAMISIGYRGAPGKDRCRLAPGVSRATRRHEKISFERHLDVRYLDCWREICRHRIAWCLYYPVKNHQVF